MKLSLAVAASALAAGSTASIISIQVPQTIAVGKAIPVKLVNNIDQSSTYETSITFGLGANPKAPNTYIGSAVSSIFLQGKLHAVSLTSPANSHASRRYYACCTFYKKHNYCGLVVG